MSVNGITDKMVPSLVPPDSIRASRLSPPRGHVRQRSDAILTRSTGVDRASDGRSS
jgi:hypothetical protein